MKKISLIFIISAMFFYTACGGNSKNSEKEENPDSTNIVIDEDESTFDADSTDTEELHNDIETDDTDTDNDAETEPTNDNDKETSTNSDNDIEHVAENCEIDESYTVSSFSEYFTLKSIFVLNNNINGTRDTTANLYLENSDYSFESDKVYDMSEAESNTNGLNVYTSLYYAPLGNVLVPTLSVSAEITNDQISSGEKDENGRITVESATLLSMS